MSDSIKRQKIMEREQFSYEDKVKLASKSDDRCCHCGKKVFVGYGATVEHFIPLSQGGTNRDINMVMLCEDCNQEKGSLIYRPEDYLVYLKPEHLEKLNGYFESYISSFDFVNRDNLLACDRYKVWVNTVPENAYFSMKKRKKNQKILDKYSIPLWVKKATFDDVDKLTEYYIKYLKKYGCLDSEKSARVNIEFWLTFGCIYYIEKNNEIKTFVTVSVTKANNNVFLDKKPINHFLTINIFSYYSNDYALTLAWNLSRQIPRYICKEQNISQIPVKYCVIGEDTLCSELCEGGVIYQGDRFTTSFMILYSGELEALPEITEDKDLNRFFEKFVQINKKRFDLWFKIHGEETYQWMIRELELEKNEEESED